MAICNIHPATASKSADTRAQARVYSFCYATDLEAVVNTCRYNAIQYNCMKLEFLEDSATPLPVVDTDAVCEIRSAELITVFFQF